MQDINLHLWAAIGLSDDRAEAIDEVRPWVASQAETFSKWRVIPVFLRRFERDFEAVSQVYDRLEHLSHRSGHKTAVSDELAEYLAFVGSPDECLERLGELEKLGLDGVTLSVKSGGRKQRMELIHQGIIKPLEEN